MEEGLVDILALMGFGIEVFGVLVMLVGICIGTISLVRRYRWEEDGIAYKKYRQDLGRSIVLGLEFLIAGDIIRTIVIADSFTDVGILALIILLRFLLSITLHLEIEGCWPWQQKELVS